MAIDLRGRKCAPQMVVNTLYERLSRSWVRGDEQRSAPSNQSQRSFGPDYSYIDGLGTGEHRETLAYKDLYTFPSRSSESTWKNSLYMRVFVIRSSSSSCVVSVFTIKCVAGFARGVVSAQTNRPATFPVLHKVLGLLNLRARVVVHHAFLSLPGSHP